MNSIYCGACLVMDVKMYSISSYISYRQLYMDLVKSAIDSAMYLCYECAAVLKKCMKFKQKCIRAHTALSEVYDNSITNVQIKDIDRVKYSLISRLEVTNTICIPNIVECKEEKVKDDLDDKSIKIETKTACIEINDVEIDFVKKTEKIKNETSDYYFNYEDMTPIFASDDDEPLSNKVRKTTISKKEQKSKLFKKNKKKYSDKVQNVMKLTKQGVKTGSKRKNTKDDVNSTEQANNSKRHRKTAADEETKEYVTIIYLTMDEAKKDFLLRKEKHKYKNASFKCEFCFRGFAVKTTYDNHMKKHDLEIGNYECEVCHIRFTSPRTLSKHCAEFHIRKFTCKTCPYVCFGRNSALNHIGSHKGSSVTCEQCGRTVSSYSNLLMHMRSQHTGEIVCDLCGDCFITPRGLRIHHHVKHKLEKNLKQGPKCDECNIHFATEQAWRTHLTKSSKHSVVEEKSNSCNYCGKCFETEMEFKMHFKEPPAATDRTTTLTCTKCGQRVSSCMEYRKHIRMEHPNYKNPPRPRDVVCEQCGKVFQNISILKYHQHEHTGERPYKCTECPKAFFRPANLLKHSSVHSGARPYDCDMCDRKFATQSTLLKHKKCHLNIRPHKCEICGKRFIHACEMRYHVQHAHNKVPYPKRSKAKKSELDTHQ